MYLLFLLLTFILLNRFSFKALTPKVCLCPNTLTWCLQNLVWIFIHALLFVIRVKNICYVCFRAHIFITSLLITATCVLVCELHPIILLLFCCFLGFYLLLGLVLLYDFLSYLIKWLTKLLKSLAKRFYIFLLIILVLNLIVLISFWNLFTSHSDKSLRRLSLVVVVEDSGLLHFVLHSEAYVVLHLTIVVVVVCWLVYVTFQIWLRI